MNARPLPLTGPKREAALARARALTIELRAQADGP
jgi:hypothetical protein